jgi:hypothetical protein
LVIVGSGRDAFCSKCASHAAQQLAGLSAGIAEASMVVVGAAKPLVGEVMCVGPLAAAGARRVPSLDQIGSGVTGL